MLHRGRNGLVVGVGRSNQNCINKNNMCVKSENGMRSKKTSENSLNCQRTTTWGCCWACHHRHLQPTLSHCVMFSHQICGWPEPSTWLRWNSAVTGGVWPPCNVEVTKGDRDMELVIFARSTWSPCDHHISLNFIELHPIFKASMLLSSDLLCMFPLFDLSQLHHHDITPG